MRLDFFDNSTYILYHSHFKVSTEYSYFIVTSYNFCRLTKIFM